MPLLATLILALVPLSPTRPVLAAISSAGYESCLLDKINADRAEIGIQPLSPASELNDDVREWSRWMRENELAHMPQARRDGILPTTTTAWAENIAWHSTYDVNDCSTIHTMLMGSSGHRANILNPTYRFGAFGAHGDSTGWWVTEVFFDATNYPCQGTFCDDDGSMFEPYIESVAVAGITKGCDPVDKRYCPDAHVTRGQMAAFLSRALGLTDGGSIDFVDDDGSMFEAEIERVAAAGITNGCDPVRRLYCPNDLVTREQMAAFLARAFDLPHLITVEFTDDDSSIFETEIESIATAGITNGCDPVNRRYCPDALVTRGQMAAFLARALGL